MKRKVRGTLFADYVRMLRRRKGVDWSRYLVDEDLGYLAERIESERWYPMESFERMGLAILAEIAAGHLEVVRAFGRVTIDGLITEHPELVAPDDPRESLMRFQVLRRSFFDYAALELTELLDGRAMAYVHYGMGKAAEEAATWQTLGSFDRLIELAGGKNIEVSLAASSWTGANRTVIRMRWSH